MSAPSTTPTAPAGWIQLEALAAQVKPEAIRARRQDYSGPIRCTLADGELYIEPGDARRYLRNVLRSEQAGHARGRGVR